jgi:hypothetical protein
MNVVGEAFGDTKKENGRNMADIIHLNKALAEKVLEDLLVHLKEKRVKTLILSGFRTYTQEEKKEDPEKEKGDWQGMIFRYWFSAEQNNLEALGAAHHIAGIIDRYITDDVDIIG